MEITTFRRFEFSASRQLPGGRLHGNNFHGWAGVTGGLDQTTGMIVNITELKAWLNQVLDRYDHRKLNNQLDGKTPTTPEIARALSADLQERLELGLRLNGLRLDEMDEQAAVVENGQALQVLTTAFSAAHRTHAPRLSAAQNQQLYGRCNNPAGHGHNYRVEVGLAPNGAAGAQALAEITERYDHRNLSADLPEFAQRNVVTEALASQIARRIPGAKWARVWETPDFFAEYRVSGESYRLGRRYRFHAAHRLHSLELSLEQNRQIYGKCNRLDPHGHTYQVEVAVQGQLDPVTETAFDLAYLDDLAAEVIGPLDYTFLDQDLPYFRENPSTGENIAKFLFGAFQAHLNGALVQVDVWETANNLFRANELTKN